MANNITKVIRTKEYTAYIRPGIIPIPLTYREYSVHGGSYNKKEETDDDEEGGM